VNISAAVGRDHDVKADAYAVHLTIPAKAEYITLSRLALAGLSALGAVPGETIADLKLALTEACSNSVRHAYDGEDRDGPGVVDITYELHPDRVVIEVCDEGRGFVPTPPGERDALSESGLGLAIIQALSDELELGERDDRPGSRLRMVKRFDGTFQTGF
jgi:serine/threonine-protein kinase RsbW